MDFLKSLLPFFDLYPYWVRYVAVVWILSTATMLAILVLARQAHELEWHASAGKRDKLNRPIESYYEAAAAGFLADLDCQRHVVASRRGLITIERSACEAFQELRHNMQLLVRYKAVTEGKVGTLPAQRFNYENTIRFFKSFFEESEHGPYKKHFLSLLDRLMKAGAELTSLRTAGQLHQWNAGSNMTVDDMFIGNSFLDWTIGTEIKNRVSVEEIVRLGPFFEKSFDSKTEGRVAMREFRNEETGRPMTFHHIIGLYD
jgi:hypothetical protein